MTDDPRTVNAEAIEAGRLAVVSHPYRIGDDREGVAAILAAASREIDCARCEDGTYDRIYPHGTEYGEDGPCPDCGGSGRLRVLL